DETRRLLHSPGAARSQVHDAVLAAVARALARWCGTRRVSIDVESHGRADIDPAIDVSRTVGWFTAIYPMSIDVDPDASAADVLADVARLAGGIRDFGVGYG